LGKKSAMMGLNGKIKILLTLCFAMALTWAHCQESVVIRRETWEEVSRDIDYGTPIESNPKVEEEDSPSFFSSDALKIIVISVSIIGLVLLLIKILGGNSGEKKIKSPKQSYELANSIDELLINSDLDSILQELLNRQEYRLALRILYLITLKNLNDQKIIDWKKEKTNNDYINEISQEPYLKEFKELTYFFELTWYGEKALSAPTFQDFESRFVNFNSSIKQ